jgi:7,8-dihydropterin-6-yl-methyl-4-(beta-D-ribofuranosyl)aminobenzene 5'-phosphate synthase
MDARRVHRTPNRRGAPAAAGLLLVALAVGCEDGGPDMSEHVAPRPAPEAAVIHVVYDNHPPEPGMIRDWGFAAVVRGYAKTILFDTGAKGGALLRNMETLGIRPREIDVIVLSHAHGDHIGGLEAFLRENSAVTVYLPAAFPEAIKQRARNAGATVVQTAAPRAICEGVCTTAVLGEGIREQALVLETADGLVVVTGCAHPGVVALARSAREHGGKPVVAVLGGFHMSSFSSEQIDEVIAALKALGVRRVGPCHCSGQATRRRMKRAFGNGWLELAPGRRASFPLP